MRILILAPHADDGELGCGGTIAKFIREGAKVYYAAFSMAEESVPPHMPRNALTKEIKNATSVLGIKEDNLFLYKYKVRRLPEHRQDILEDLVGLNKRIMPSLVFMPSLKDIHQDHQVLAQEGLRAFKKTSLLCYELPWNNLIFSNNCFISIKEEDLKMKIAAFKCYISQEGRPYSSGDYLRSLAVTRGIQVGVKYAEVFEVLRWII